MRAFAAIVLVLSACGQPAAPDPFGALYGVRVGDVQAIHWAGDPSALEAVAPDLQIKLRNVRDAPLPPRARAVLQNDAWGLASRIEQAPLSSARLTALRSEATAVARGVALSTGALAAISSTRPPRELGSGWREVGTELPVLSHERAFGLRRLFRIYHRGDERAIVGELVALDIGGRPHLTGITTEIEVLELGSEGAVSAQLFELDRAALLGSGSALREERLVHRVPGLGADRFFLELDPPEPIESLPCRRCHDDADENSLPRADLDPQIRLRALLAQVRAPW